MFTSLQTQIVFGAGPGRRTDYCYDNPALGANVTVEARGSAAAGQLVTCSTGRSSLLPGAVAVPHVYDGDANRIETWDGRNHKTGFDYAACSDIPQGLYLTKTTDPMNHAVSIQQTRRVGISAPTLSTIRLPLLMMAAHKRGPQQKFEDTLRR